MDTAVSSRALHVEGLREGKLLGFSHPAPKYNTLGMVLLLRFTDTGMRAQMRKTSGWGVMGNAWLRFREGELWNKKGLDHCSSGFSLVSSLEEDCELIPVPGC